MYILQYIFNKQHMHVLPDRCFTRCLVIAQWDSTILKF